MDTVKLQLRTAVVTLSKEVDNDVLKKAVEDKDYKVTAVK